VRSSIAQRSGSPGELFDLGPAASGPHGGDHLSSGMRGLSTARAVLRVLTFMAQHPEGVTAREVAGELGKSVSTAYGLLASLYEEGYAVREPGRGFRLRAEATIGRRPPQPPQAKALSGAVDQLFARTHRRSYLVGVEAGAIVITAACGRQGIPRVPGLKPRIGRSAHALAMGKVVLSLLPEEGRRRYIERGLRTYTPRTIVSPQALMSELDRVRSSGFAVDRGEFHPEYCCVAAPVLDAHGRFHSVLGLSTLSRTFEPEAPHLVRAVREVAAAVGGGHGRTRPANDIRPSHVRAQRAA
jgi:IclR family transcriptional regulator, acetate operon repressor